MSKPPVLASAGGEVPAVDGDLRLHGRWLLVARTTWAAAVLLNLAVVVGAIPIDLRLLQTICAGAACIDSQQLTAHGAQSLQKLGLSVGTYGVLSLSFTLLTACIWFGVALVIVSRKSDEWMALLAALMLVFQGANTLTNPVQQVSSMWQFPALVVSYAGFLLLFLALLLFPDGRFRPRWTGWLFVVWAIALWFGNFGSFPQALLPFFLLLWASLLLSLLVIQVYRYRRVYSPAQRQQTKWVVLGVVIVLLFEIASALSTIFFPSLSQPGSLSGLLIAYGIFFIPILIPLCIGLAILRYRLWDVDVLINKALVYGGLTGLLGVVYAGLIIGLESLAEAISGHAGQQPLVLVVSTLAIAALFQPVRTRLQALIDRRFYRRKYDAARTLTMFSATLRNEVNLKELQDHLLEVVQKTMQPAQVSLWLRQPERHSMELPHHLEPHGSAPTNRN
jgi:hypothetical protein